MRCFMIYDSAAVDDLPDPWCDDAVGNQSHHLCRAASNRLTYVDSQTSMFPAGAKPGWSEPRETEAGSSSGPLSAAAALMMAAMARRRRLNWSFSTGITTRSLRPQQRAPSRRRSSRLSTGADAAQAQKLEIEGQRWRSRGSSAAERLALQAAAGV